MSAAAGHWWLSRSDGFRPHHCCAPQAELGRIATVGAELCMFNLGTVNLSRNVIDHRCACQCFVSDWSFHDFSWKFESSPTLVRGAQLIPHFVAWATAHLKFTLVAQSFESHHGPGHTGSSLFHARREGPVVAVNRPHERTRTFWHHSKWMQARQHKCSVALRGANLWWPHLLSC